MLIYVNEGWKDHSGGQLELWDEQMHKREVSVSPVFNRTVIFSTTSTSFHGQPNPVRSENSRKSIALYYYYFNGRPEENGNESTENSTLWKERPNLGF